MLGRARPSIAQLQLTEAALAEEVNRLEKSLVQTRHQILEIQRKVSEGMGAQEGSIFDAHLLVLEDRTLLDEGPQAVPGLAARLEVPEADADALVALLERDGLVRREGALVCIG